VSKQVKKTFGKQQFLASKQYAQQKDILHAVLEEGKTYTSRQVEKRINDFLLKEAK
jgi:hypothetical protein